MDGRAAQAPASSLGVIVLLFPSVLTVFAWRLNAAFLEGRGGP